MGLDEVAAGAETGETELAGVAGGGAPGAVPTAPAWPVGVAVQKDCGAGGGFAFFVQDPAGDDGEGGEAEGVVRGVSALRKLDGLAGALSVEGGVTGGQAVGAGWEAGEGVAAFGVGFGVEAEIRVLEFDGCLPDRYAGQRMEDVTGDGS